MKQLISIIGFLMIFSACGKTHETAPVNEVPPDSFQEQGAPAEDNVAEQTPIDSPGDSDANAIVVDEENHPDSEITGPEDDVNDTSKDLVTKISDARKEKQQLKDAKSAVLILQKVQEVGAEVVVEVRLRNPEMRPIAAVRSFIAYDPKVLNGEEINLPADGAFSIPAPGEFEFDHEMGMVKLGLSVPEGGTTEMKDQLIAKLVFTRTTDDFTTLDFFDFDSDEGHTMVLEKIGQDMFQNVLRSPEVPTLLFLPRS